MWKVKVPFSQTQARLGYLLGSCVAYPESRTPHFRSPSPFQEGRLWSHTQAPPTGSRSRYYLVWRKARERNWAPDSLPPLYRRGPHSSSTSIKTKQAKHYAWWGRQRWQGPRLQGHTYPLYSTEPTRNPEQVKTLRLLPEGNHCPARVHLEFFLFPLWITSHFRDTCFLFLGLNCLIKLSSLSVLPNLWKKWSEI